MRASGECGGSLGQNLEDLSGFKVDLVEDRCASLALRHQKLESLNATLLPETKMV